MNRVQAYRWSAHSLTGGARTVPLGVGYVSNGKVFSLNRRPPSLLSADDAPFWCEGFIGAGSEVAHRVSPTLATVRR
jgi:hypothetical protein